MDAADLIERARTAREITSINPDDSRGAEAYLQAYGYIASGGQARTNWGTRRLAMRYLIMTASPALTSGQLAAARTAQGVVKRLS